MDLRVRAALGHEAVVGFRLGVVIEAPLELSGVCTLDALLAHRLIMQRGRSHELAPSRLNFLCHVLLSGFLHIRRLSRVHRSSVGSV